MPRKKKLIPAEMPAGAARNEAKAIVADQLAEQAEHEGANMESFDGSKVSMKAVENEIAQHFNFVTNEFEVTNARDGYCYLWGRIHPNSHAEILSRVGRYLGAGIPGYELVNGPEDKFPECWHLRTETGTRRIGDVQLYRVNARVWQALQDKMQLINRAREAGVSSSLLARAARYPRYVRAVETEGDPMEYMRDRARSRGGIPRSQYDAEVIKTLAVHKLVEDARDGKLYGMEMK